MPKRMREDLPALIQDAVTRETSIKNIDNDNKSFMMIQDFEQEQSNINEIMAFSKDVNSMALKQARFFSNTPKHKRRSTLTNLQFDFDDFEEHSYRKPVKTIQIKSIGKLNKTLSLKRPKSLNNSLFRK